MKNTKKDFKAELEKLISKHEDSILAKYIDNCLKEYDHANYMSQVENPFDVYLTKMPEVSPNYIDNCLKEYDHANYMSQVENPFGVDLTKMPEVSPNTPQPPQAIPANVGNNVSTGWSNPFAGTSWGIQ